MPANTNQLTNLGNNVTTRTISWSDLCRRAWGPEFNAADHGIYQFSNGRRFDSTDMNNTGIYNDELGENFLLLDTHYPDAPGNFAIALLQGGRLERNGG